MKRYGIGMATLVCVAAGAAQAQFQTNDPFVLGQGRSLQPSGPTHYIGSFFDIFTELEMMGPPQYAPSPGQSGFRESPTRASLHISLNAQPPGPPVMIDSFFDVFFELSPTGGFDTEMLAMNLQGIGPTGPFMIRESPTLQSLGHTTITPIGGGMYHIDSFFDVFTELSIDGGQTWMPSSGPTHMSMLPSPGSAALLTLGGLAVVRRRRA